MSQPLLCETVTGRTLSELRAARDAVRDADLVELRLDGVSDVDVAGALEGRQRPVVVTCRPRWEGGLFDGSEEERRRLLEQALALGAEYVDIEWKAGFESLVQSTGGARIVLSNHDFVSIPRDIHDRCRAMRATGAEIVKIAASVSRLSDTLPLREVTRGGRMVAIAMGPAGIATRILPAHFGSCWTYCGNGFAPGQIPATTMVRTYRFRQVRSDTTVYGLVGNPVVHSLSPAMHNAAFAAIGENAVYLPLQAADFNDFRVFAASLPMAGASVTIPFKLDALRAAETVEDVGHAVGAVNTLRLGSAGWEGNNTDVTGFLAPLIGTDASREPAHGVTLRGARASVLGAGGAARAVVHGLMSEGAKVRVHARRADRARAVAEPSGADVGDWPPAAGSWDILVNCTPLGSAAHSEDSPMSDAKLDGRLVYDLIYAPAETRLMREARAAGCAVIGGLPMLVAQAERQFEWWTGRKPPTGVMAEAARVATAEANATA